MSANARPVLVLVVVGLFLSATVVLVSARSDPGRYPGDHGVALTAAERHGRQLFARTCAGCHTLDAADAVAQVGPNLDQLAPNGIPAIYVSQAVEGGKARGVGNMPAGLYSDDDLQDVARFVCRVTTQARRPDGARTPTYCNPDSPAPEPASQP